MSVEGCLGGNYFSHPKRLSPRKKDLTSTYTIVQNESNKLEKNI